MKKSLFYLLTFTAVFMLPFQLFAKENNTVFVSILPQKYFIEQISEDLIDIEVMVAPGASPATYEPKSSQMRKLAKSDAYFAIGVPFEAAWLDRIAGVNPEMKVVHTDQGIEKLEMTAHHHHEDEHHDEHGDMHHEEDGHHDDHKEMHHDEDDHHDDHKAAHHDEHEDEAHHEDDHHHEGGLDPHIWLSPVLVKKQTETYLTSLSMLYPEHKAVFEKNAADFIIQIDELDKQLRKTLEGKEDMKFMVFHPSWGYFANDYHLEQIAIEIEGKDPKPAQLQNLIGKAKEENIQVVFAQPQFSTKSAQIVAKEINGSVLLLDPLAEDWLANMVEVAKQFAKTVK